MGLLAYWKWDNYTEDMKAGPTYHFNSKQDRLLDAMNGTRLLWLVSGRPSQRGGREFVLVARLHVEKTGSNPPGFKYGAHRVWADAETSTYFDPDGPDASDLLMRLRFASDKPIASRSAIGQSLQTIRPLKWSDEQLLEEWARKLDPL